MYMEMKWRRLEKWNREVREWNREVQGTNIEECMKTKQRIKTEQYREILDSEKEKYRKMKHSSTRGRQSSTGKWNTAVQGNETQQYREMTQKCTGNWNRAVQGNKTEKYREFKQWNKEQWNREVQGN